MVDTQNSREVYNVGLQLPCCLVDIVSGYLESDLNPLALPFIEGGSFLHSGQGIHVFQNDCRCLTIQVNISFHQHDEYCQKGAQKWFCTRADKLDRGSVDENGRLHSFYCTSNPNFKIHYDLGQKC